MMPFIFLSLLGTAVLHATAKGCMSGRSWTWKLQPVPKRSGRMRVWLMLAACALSGLATSRGLLLVTTPSSVPFHRPGCRRTPAGMTALKQSPRSEVQPASVIKPYSSLDWIPDDLKACFRVFGEIMERPDDLGSLEKLQTDLVKLEDPLEVATVGCFSSGKSTLINALVRAKVCETGKLPVTMKLRRIPYQNGDHIILIDTMGVDAKDFPKHKEETADAIANADAVIFVVSANNLGTTGDGDIEDMLRSCKTPGILVVTHWDQVEEIKDQKAIRERAQELAGHLFPQQDKKTVFFVDAKSAESQRALKKAVVQSNNSDFVKLEKCIQTKLADKGNKQRIKLARVLNKLLSLCQSKVDLLNQRIEHLQKKTWEAEMEQVEEDFRQMELRLEETIPVQAERARWSRQRFSDREHDAKRARNVSRELAMLDPAQNGGALDSVLKGAWGGANAAFRATEGNLNATMLGSVFGGIAGIFNAWSEASNEEQRRIENKKTIKEFNKEAKALKDSLPGLERKWEDEENRLKELENQYSQLRGKRDKEKAKVTRQQKNANKIQERCRDLISRFDQHLHRIRELIKDQKCF